MIIEQIYTGCLAQGADYTESDIRFKNIFDCSIVMLCFSPQWINYSSFAVLKMKDADILRET